MNDDLIMFGLVGLVGYLLYDKKQRQAPATTPYNPNTWQQTTGAAPTTNTGSQEWLQWAGLVVSLYGAIDDLWMPGGPFYNSGYTQEELQTYYDDVSDPYGGGDDWAYARLMARKMS